MNISFKEIQIGQKLITKINPNNKGATRFGSSDKPDFSWTGGILRYSYGGFNKPDLYFSEGTVLTIVHKDLKNKTLSLINDNDCVLTDSKLNKIGSLSKDTKIESVYISELKSSTIVYGDVSPHPDNIQYRIFKDGKVFKPKYYDDMGKVKYALLVMFNYHINSWDLIQKYKDRNPELNEYNVPEFIEIGGSNKFRLNQNDTKSVDIMMYTNKKNPTKVDFDVHEYFKEICFLSNVTCQFGSATRELFKNIYKDNQFKFILVYVPDEYREKSRLAYFDFSSLKESVRIKSILSDCNFKDIKKITKHGKTAIAFKNLNDMGILMSKLKKDEYFILDCDGDELVEQNERFIKLKLLGF